MSNIVAKLGSPDQPTGRSNGEEGCTGNGQGRHRRDNPKATPKTKRSRDGEYQSSRPMTLAIMAMEYVWLWDVRHGISINEIAMREGFSYRRVHYGVGRSRAQERNCEEEAATRPPRLTPLFPVGSYVPQSLCGHRGPIEPGSPFYCVVCHSSGIDNHPALKRDPLTDPAPEPKPKPAPKKTKAETRKVRRQRVFAIHP